MKANIHFLVQPSPLELKYIPTASLQRGKTLPPTSVMDMTLNNLMVNQSFEECGVLFIAIAPKSTVARNGCT